MRARDLAETHIGPRHRLQFGDLETDVDLSNFRREGHEAACVGVDGGRECLNRRKRRERRFLLGHDLFAPGRIKRDTPSVNFRTLKLKISPNGMSNSFI